MNRLSIALIFSFLTFGNYSSFAQDSCDPDGTTVVFINGVFVRAPEDAALTARTLERTLGVTNINGSPVEFQFAHNPSRVLSSNSDLIDSVKQKSQETGVAFSTVLSYFLFSTSGLEGAIQGLPEPVRSVLLSSAVEYYGNKLQSDRVVAPDFRPNDPDLAAINTVISNIPKNQAILIIGHSQGSLYANLAYRWTVDPNNSSKRNPSSVLVSSFAVAASSISGGFYKSATAITDGYSTSSSDKIIASIRTQAPFFNPLPATATPVGSSLFGHSAIEDYLSISPLKDHIKANMMAALSLLKVSVANQSQCRMEIEVIGSSPGWTVPGKISMSGFQSTPISQFQILGDPLSTCGGEMGGPVFSASVPVNAQFFSVTTVTGVPFVNSINRRQCSSFVAYVNVPDPLGVQPPKRRIWANGTGRAFLVRGGSPPIDREYQVRYNSGDPWSELGKKCEVGSASVPFGNFSPSFLASCEGRLVALP